MYADDTIIYCDGKNATEISNNLNNCLENATAWYSANCLALNGNKTVSRLLGFHVTSENQNELCLE